MSSLIQTSGSRTSNTTKRNLKTKPLKTSDTRNTKNALEEKYKFKIQSCTPFIEKLPVSQPRGLEMYKLFDANKKILSLLQQNNSMEANLLRPVTSPVKTEHWKVQVCSSTSSVMPCLTDLKIKSQESIRINFNSTNTVTKHKEMSTRDEFKCNLPRHHIQNKRRKDLLCLVNEAIESNKVFSIGDENISDFQTIREALKTRGWFEKCCPKTLYEEGTISWRTFDIVSRLLTEPSTNLIWATRAVHFESIKDDTIVSQFPKKAHFTSKAGLCHFLATFHWFYESGLSQTISPRTFRIRTGNDVDYFRKEFRLTACVSLLKIVVDQVLNVESESFFKDGKVPISTVYFARTQSLEYIHFREHEDIDRATELQATYEEWNEFLSWFHNIVHEEEHFQTTPYSMIESLYTTSKTTLERIQPYWPLLELEGSKNLWVVKPANSNCGKGVAVMRDLREIIRHATINKSGKIKHSIAQKYIERPLLIYETKFDIRQWFLITSVYPMVIWIYKECYLRFCSKPFSLVDLHESIHLTNNTIQRNYTNDSSRHPKLPSENMWHDSTFQKYLRNIDHPDKWDEVILPGIKQGIIGAVLASQDEMVDRPNSFELYGADFLLGSDFTPILLEINARPASSPSTAVTADLCNRGLQDVIKVVLDRKQDPQADTGQFEVLYRQEMGPRPYYMGLDLTLTGSKINSEICKKSRKEKCKL